MYNLVDPEGLDEHIWASLTWKSLICNQMLAMKENTEGLNWINIQYDVSVTCLNPKF